MLLNSSLLFTPRRLLLQYVNCETHKAAFVVLLGFSSSIDPSPRWAPSRYRSFSLMICFMCFDLGFRFCLCQFWFLESVCRNCLLTRLLQSGVQLSFFISIWIWLMINCCDAMYCFGSVYMMFGFRFSSDKCCRIFSFVIILCRILLFNGYHDICWGAS